MKTAPDTVRGRADPHLSVAAEMAAIFARLPHAAPSIPDTPSAKSAAVRPSNGWRWAASFAAAVLVVAAVLIIMARPTPVASFQPQARRALAVPIAPAPTMPVTPAPRIKAPSPAVPPTPTRVERPKRSQVALKNPGRCPASATEAWCRRAEVVAADDRLRDAYDEAVRAGIDRDMLVSVRDDWARLRGRANRDPEALIRGYGLLTRQLYDELEKPGR